MKVLIPILIGLLVVGCGKKQSGNTNESNNTPENSAKKNEVKEIPSKGDDKSSTAAKPVKELTLREKVIGTYEIKKDGNALRVVLLETGIFEKYSDGEKDDEREDKWKVVNGEIHVTYNKEGVIVAHRINKDISITWIARIWDGKRKALPKEEQQTYKKIK